MGGGDHVLCAEEVGANCAWRLVIPGPGAQSGRIGFGWTFVVFGVQSQSRVAFQLDQQR